MLTETKSVENHDRVLALLNSVERDGVSDLLKWLEESDFFTAPASRAYHGDYVRTRVVGFEPTNAGVKFLCLTAWLYPYAVYLIA